MDKEKIKKEIRKLSSNFAYGKEFEESIENIVDYVNYCTEQREDALNKLKNFNKDEEIKRLKETLENTRKNSLFDMTDNERIADEEFRNEHYKKCKNGNKFIYEITGTGIGNILEISCPICKEKKDITDISSW